ncbi:MAG TPA: hypothetical protein ENI92_04120 [Bacteroidetes bacterium]|nr:hypothetical protein [Bacteroidota bacterium]
MQGGAGHNGGRKGVGATLRIAVPCFGEEVAPVFGSTRRFRVWVFEGGEVRDYRELAVEGADPLHRYRLVKELDTDVVICNGIEEHCREMLRAVGVEVVPGVVGTATDALFGYLAGRIRPPDLEHSPAPGEIHPHAADTVEWTRELFIENGWRVRRVREEEFYPVDLTAERTCPVCGRTVRVAVCCGAHAYRVDEEIRQFQRITAGHYQARVYVHQPLPSVVRRCRDFGIELLDPVSFVRHEKSGRGTGRAPLAPLTGPVEGHANTLPPGRVKEKRTG